MEPINTPVSDYLFLCRLFLEGTTVMVELIDTHHGTWHATIQEAVDDASSRFRRGALPAEGLVAFYKTLYSLYIDTVSTCFAQVAYTPC